ncbi:DNA-directed RNA polymerase alpha chain, putative [Babesia caballi]|uniref:DNA-directed RNA polymerase alpha chain, putative n=1 Tax=Babesia caballi TaxID=5871 RepID=A0AAV4LT77_BABCB|nr:DNA-directed RNA polymerase alpha chain, putative [Babesia caballi]
MPIPRYSVALVTLFIAIEVVHSVSPARRCPAVGHLVITDHSRDPSQLPLKGFITCPPDKHGYLRHDGGYPRGSVVPGSLSFEPLGNSSRLALSASENDDISVQSIGIPESTLKPKPLPVDQGVPLENQPMPPWALDFVTGNHEPKEPYTPRHYSEAEIAEHIAKVNEETRKRSVTRRLRESTGAPVKSYGFKFKQIQPVRHHNGKAFTYFYAHSLHTDVIPVLLNSLRRVAKRHLGAGRITALRVPGMKNEFYSIVGLREDFFDLSRNLSNVIFRNVPVTATFDKPLIGRLRLKGPIIAVAGHLEFDADAQAEGVGSSSGSADDRKIEVVNKNHYLCALADDAYLDMEVKIEYIANYVIPERGPDSLNRDITPDGFIHFCSSCSPVEVFAFDGDRRGLDEESTSEIVTLELHTDGSTTPRLALLNSASFLEDWFERTLGAFHRDCKRDLDALDEAKRSVRVEELLHHELYRNVPWNPYRLPDDRLSAKHRWLYRADVKRQYPIDPESKLAKAEQLRAWQEVLDNELKHAERIQPDLTDESEKGPVRELSLREVEELAGFKAPSWVFKDPLGAGCMSQSTVADLEQAALQVRRQVLLVVHVVRGDEGHVLQQQLRDGHVRLERRALPLHALQQRGVHDGVAEDARQVLQPEDPRERPPLGVRQHVQELVLRRVVAVRVQKELVQVHEVHVEPVDVVDVNLVELLRRDVGADAAVNLLHEAQGGHVELVDEDALHAARLGQRGGAHLALGGGRPPPLVLDEGDHHDEDVLEVLHERVGREPLRERRHGEHLGDSDGVEVDLLLGQLHHPILLVQHELLQRLGQAPGQEVGRCSGSVTRAVRTHLA